MSNPRECPKCGDRGVIPLHTPLLPDNWTGEDHWEIPCSECSGEQKGGESREQQRASD